MLVRRRSMVRFLPVVLAMTSLVVAARVSIAEDAPVPAAHAKQSGLAPEFMRLVDEGAAGGKLETADVTFKRADGTSVTLVSAVHIGEKSYYVGLNESFKKYDAVLFEMVKPKEGLLPGAPGAVEQQEGRDNPIRDVQRMMKETLNLSFQLDVVDYQAKNFVHADLDAETFERLQREKGQTFPELFLKALMKAMTDPDAAAKQNPLAGGDDPEQLLHTLIRTFTRPDAERQIKLMLARQMTTVEQDASMFGGEDSVILHDRNGAAMKVLEKTLKDPGKKQVAVFYGAAHMPDMEKRLKEMGFTRAATEWRTAWDLKIRADQPSAIEQLLDGAVEELFKGLEEDEKPAEGKAEPVVVR